MARRRIESDRGSINPDADHMTIEFRYGGNFVHTPRTHYINGMVTYFDNVDVDRLSTLEIKDMIQEFGVQNSKYFYYTLPGHGPADGLYALEKDEHILGFVRSIPRNRHMTVYVEHDSDVHEVIGDLTQPPMSQANIDYGESFNEIHDDLFSQVDENRYGSYSLSNDHLFQEERSALYHGEPQDFYDVPIHTNEYEYDGDGDDKTKGSNYEENDNDGNNSDSEFYDEDNDAMLDDDNFYDDVVDTLETFIGCGKKQKNNWETDIQVEDMNMDEEKYNSDELHSASNSDEEGTTRRYKELNIDTDMDNPQFDVGMKFPSKKVLKQAIQIYGALRSYECKVVKNDKFRLSAKCKEGCKWRLYASLMQGENTYQIKSYTPKHSCSKGFHNKNITSTFLSQRYMSRIKDDPKIKKTTLQSEVHRELGYEVSTDQCYKAKRKAQTLIEGTYAQQYEKLWEYCEEIRQTNNGSSMLMKVDPPHFQRLYVCLDACKKGFIAGCRPLIGVDACHLKGTFQGQLLVSVGIDANDNMYPIAYAVAELESKDSWCWFLQLLIEDLGQVSEYGWTFISDQQKWCLKRLIDGVCGIYMEISRKNLRVRH
ncbi:uncharacterized protein LOC18781319 [Prunus persica]|uniref:uncharacterized protein LOC18781319 n=1 Tax=Prunus persica TaxID=3760 RepID=UPI0009AB967F|nr:uncharacterized protein LOC18781319 [Prunus persica]